MKHILKMLSVISAIAFSATMLCACSSQEADMSWKDKSFDLSLPTLGEDGWYLVFEDDFTGSELNEGITFGENYTGNREIWTTSPHAIRWESNDPDKPEEACWWCPNAVSLRDGNLVITSQYESNHTCDGDCPAEGRFTGGIETRDIIGSEDSNKGESDELLFSQAFGYFEVRVKFPDADGMWSAFWLQSSNMRKPSAEGVDGTEIDVFESAFRRSKTSRMGHALLWNGYGEFADSEPYITELEQDLYDGYHTFALKWTPEYYVFYIDGEATWATTGGGVSHVKEFLRLTCEIDAGDEWGPHGQKIGAFDTENPSEFLVDYIKVWQNSNYEQYEIDDSKFAGTLDTDN